VFKLRIKLKQEFIFFIHNGKYLVQLKSLNDNLPMRDEYKQLRLPIALYKIASEYSQSVIIWCHEQLYDSLNMDFILSTYITNYTMYSFHSDEGTCIGNDIGYIDWGTFVHVNKSVKYPTWIMSGDCGMASANIFLLSQQCVTSFDQLDQYLCSVAKTFQTSGLFAYSEPELFRRDYKKLIRNKWSKWELFKFVSKHYKKIWVLLLFLHLFYKYRFISPHYLLYALNYRISINNFDLHSKLDGTNSYSNTHESIDVIIPTIGRPQHVIQFLEDLKAQTYPVTRVIIVEQKPDGGKSDLEPILKNEWPFEMIHQLIRQPGACNARNNALQLVESNWVFMADDDIRISNSFIDGFIIRHKQLNQQAYTFTCLQPGQKKTLHKIVQWASFGSGCSIVKRSILTGKFFDMRYEFGFGEDVDFGMQIRNSGADIIYLPTPEMIHLKAPMGGFRNKINLLWAIETPKPSPTITLYNRTYFTSEQYQGYIFFLFLSFYKSQPIINPFRYYLEFKKRLASSEFWAKELEKTQGDSFNK
jgi:glycosyltransferase involved in cell wall biosynthesis